ESYTFDFREEAPEQAHRDMFLDGSGHVDASKSQWGHLSVGVPGSVAGMELVHQKFGTMDFKELIQPAIYLAEKGFAITAWEAERLNNTREDFIKYNTRPTAFVKEVLWKEKDTLIQTDLAGTLKRIQQEGTQDFYSGETARLLVEEMKRGNGIIKGDDLQRYTVKERTPIIFDYKDYEIISMGLPSSGGILLRQL